MKDLIIQNYHKHDSESNIMTPDSSIVIEDYAKRCIEIGSKVLSSVQHGWQGRYYNTYSVAKKYNLKFVFGTEAYWVKDRKEKDNTNAHIILLSKTEKGRRQINDILSEANETGYYFRPRLDLDLILSLSPKDVLITSACLGFWKYDDTYNIIKTLHNHFKENFMLETQYHLTDAQKKINSQILELKNDLGIQIIAGCDSHYIYPHQAQDREYFLQSKKIFYNDEEGWYMDFPDGNEAFNRFKNQGILNQKEIIEAINNTNIILDFDDIVLDDNIKLPTIYPNMSQEEKNKLFKDIIIKEWSKIKDTIPSNEIELHRKAIFDEVKTIINTNMTDYFLLDYEMVKRAIEKGGVITPSGRGCFTKDAIVVTKDTLKTIDKIQIGDEVISDDGKFHKVLDTFKYNIEEDLLEFEYKIQGSSYKKYKNICTLDHKILVNRNGIIDYIPANQLKVSDLLCSPKIKHDYKNNEEYIDLVKYNYDNYEYDDKYIYEVCPVNKEYKYSPKWLDKNKIISKCFARRLANGYIPTNEKGLELVNKFFNNTPFKTLQNYSKYCRKNGFKNKRIKRYVKKDSLFNVFIGMMYCDGFTKHNNGIGFAINNNIDNRKYIFNKYAFEKFIEKLGFNHNDLNYNIAINGKKITQIYLNSKIVYNWISTDYFKSEKDKDKLFNSELFNQSKNNIKWLYIGFLKSDGSFNKQTNKMSFDNTSLSLINAFKTMNNILGYEPLSLDVRLSYIDKRGFNNKESYKLRRPIIRKQDLIKHDDIYYYLPITKINIHNKLKTTVYDFMVEDNHSYMINNIIVHNSGVCFYVNKLLGFTKVDRVSAKIQMYPERFMSEARILEAGTLPDLDLNLANPEVFAEVQEELLGKGHSYPMIAFGTLKDKSAFKMFARASNIEAEIANDITKQIEKYEEDLKHLEEDEKDTLNILDYIDEKYHNIYNESVKYKGIIDNKKAHPCGYLIYNGDIKSEIGLIRCKSESTGKDVMTTTIDGAMADKFKFLKNDLLKVDVIDVNAKILKKVGIESLSVDDLLKITENDKKTWEIYHKGLTMCINQVERNSTASKIKKYKVNNIVELSYFIAAIRPGFKSMYHIFESRQPFNYNIKALDKLIQTQEMPYSFIVFQEQVMKVLSYAGISIDESYNIIKAISKKKKDIIMKAKEKVIDGFFKRVKEEEPNLTDEQIKEKSHQVWIIIESCIAYLFNSPHAYCVSIDSLTGAFLKANYPYEFYETVLQIYTDKNKKDKVSAIKEEMEKGFGIKVGDIRFGMDNRGFKSDKDNNRINQDLSCIKYLNTKIAEELYELKGKEYKYFIDLIYDMHNNTSCNFKQLKILTMLNYFNMFGKNKKLLTLIDNYESKLKNKGLKDTTKEKRLIELREIESTIENKSIDIKEQIKNEIEYCGYEITKLEKLPQNIYIVTSIDTKYTPKLKLYCIKSGEKINVKCYKRDLNNNPFGEFSVIQVKKIKPKVKSIEVNGQWIPTNEKELILSEWEVLK